MGGQRQKTQKYLAFMPALRGEAPTAGREGTEPSTVKRTPQSPALEERLEGLHLWSGAIYASTGMLGVILRR